jgi:hypothetical protein
MSSDRESKYVNCHSVKSSTASLRDCWASSPDCDIAIAIAPAAGAAGVFAATAPSSTRLAVSAKPLEIGVQRGFFTYFVEDIVIFLTLRCFKTDGPRACAGVRVHACAYWGRERRAKHPPNQPGEVLGAPAGAVHLREDQRL